MNDVTRDEKSELMHLREELKKDLKLEVANFKIWLFASVLSNLVLLGLPAIGVFLHTSATATSALSTSIDNRERLDARVDFMRGSGQRLDHVERHLEETTGFSPIVPVQEIPR